MDRAHILTLARQHASRYTNRHYPDNPVHTFTADALVDFAKALRADLAQDAARWRLVTTHDDFAICAWDPGIGEWVPTTSAAIDRATKDQP